MTLASILSLHYQVTLTFSTILVGLVVFGAISIFAFRYKYLTKYSADPNETVRTDFKKDDIVDSINKKKRRNLNANSNYLDEFLSAIKIFGYLERPVFHELTKNMTTQKLSWDEILYLDEKLGFSIVVDGSVQIFTKITDNYNNSSDFQNLRDLDFSRDEVLIIGTQKYQLLNEIKSGVPLSSLNSTLDLFSTVSTDVLAGGGGGGGTSGGIPGRNDEVLDSNPISSASSLDLNNEASSKPSSLPKQDKDTIYPDIIARPKFSKHDRHGATIAIIPNSAFQRIHYKYPKATAHIVTMVKNRLFKVTMNTIHNYMGLTDEILDTESKLNSGASVSDHLSSAIEHYKASLLDTESDTIRDDSIQTIGTSSLLSSKINLREYEFSRQSSSNRLSIAVSPSILAPNHPGDLLSSVPISRKSLLNLDLYPRSSTRTSSQLGNNSTQLGGNSSQIGNKYTSNGPNSGADTSRNSDQFDTGDKFIKNGIINELFKLLGINEDSSFFTNYHNSSNIGNLSSSSSINGLSSLVTDSPTLVNPFNRNQIYEDYATRARFDSFSSLGSNNFESLSSRASPKIYNTINQAQLNVYNSSMRGSNIGNIDNVFDMNQRSKSNSVVNHSPVDFGSVKEEFVKALNIKFFDPNTVIIEQDSFNSGLYYVVDGTLEVQYSKVSNGRTLSRKRSPIETGGVAGYLSTLIGIKSLCSVKTPRNSGAVLAYITKKDWTNLMDKYYQFSLPLAIKMKSLLTKQFLTIDFALEYCNIQAGEVLAAEGDQANGFHIIVSGRFRVVKSNEPKSMKLNSVGAQEPKNKTKSIDSNNFTVLGEYGHGESVGEVEVLTASRRTSSLIAVRDSETARIPRTLFEILSSQNPSIMVKVSRIVANKVAAAQNDISLARTNPNISIAPITSSRSSLQSPASYTSGNYKTITILPTVKGLPVREFALKLIDALKAIGRNVIALDQASVLTHLGRHAFDDTLAQLKLSGYFATLEDQYETVVYICDSSLKSSWTSTCISQGDCILLLANAEDYEAAICVGDYERLLIKYKTTARTDLCLLHSEKYVAHGSTSLWLKSRTWVQGHHHIQMTIPNSIKTGMLKKKSIIGDLAARLSEAASNNPIKTRLEDVRSRLKFSRTSQGNGVSNSQIEPYKNDFLRLARLLSNEAIGLILGGGGARGISHLGIVTALEKHGIPIDIIGGTSIGAFVGGLYATEYNSVSIYGKVKKFSKRIGSMWRNLLDLTFPVTSYLTGYEFNRGIWKALGFAEIEDSWVKFYCNSTNITNSTMDIHETGYSWRFIRASMSLAGLLPPIAYEGCMLLDGGYLDNLPVLEMKKRGIKYILAVDVGSVDDRSPMNYGDTLSGFWVLLNRWNPFSKHADIPNMMDIQSRLAYVASVNALETAKNTPGVMYLRPPIDDYATLDFGKFQEIYGVGLKYGDEMFTKWEQEGNLPEIVEKMKIKRDEKRPQLFRRNSL